MITRFRKTHDILGEGTEFSLDGRSGTVFQCRPEGFLVHWHSPAEAGCIDPGPLLTHELAYRASTFGRLVVLRRADAALAADAGIPDENRTPDEIRRRNYRDAHCLAAREMIDEGLLRDRRADFDRKGAEIAARAAQIEHDRARADVGMRRKRAGARTGIVCLEHFDPADKGRTVFNWYRPWLENHGTGHFDAYRNCGLTRFHGSETNAIVRAVVRKRLDMERPTIRSITTSAQAAVGLANLHRGGDPGLAIGGNLTHPGYDFVSMIIDEEAPMTHAIRKRGLKIAYRDMHSIGMGLRTTWTLEGVEIDEYTCDLMLILKATGLFERLTPLEKKAFGVPPVSWTVNR